jgi:hypothetical protein
MLKNKPKIFENGRWFSLQLIKQTNQKFEYMVEVKYLPDLQEE